MNPNEPLDVEGLAKAWEVSTSDLTGRIGAAIGATTDIQELLQEVRALRRELDEMRRSMLILQAELVRARSEPITRASTRFAPYVPTESLIRLS